MNTTSKNRLIEKINHLSDDQLKLITILVNQLELKSDFSIMTLQESSAMKKWEYLLKYDQEMDENEPLSDAELDLVRQVLCKQKKNRPIALKKNNIFIADDFNAPLPDDILDLFYQ